MADTDTTTPSPADMAKAKQPVDGGATGATATGPFAGVGRLPEDHPLVTAYARQKAENETLKAKATRLDQIEESQKTDAERFAERLAEAETQVANIPVQVAESLKGHLVALHGISDEDRDLYLTSTDPAVLLRQAQGLVVRSKGRIGVVPTQGTADPAASKVSSFDLGRERGRARYQKQ
jgi:hypothetical protein